jgi:hypothetical protein
MAFLVVKRLRRAGPIARTNGDGNGRMRRPCPVAADAQPASTVGLLWDEQLK